MGIINNAEAQSVLRQRTTDTLSGRNSIDKNGGGNRYYLRETSLLLVMYMEPSLASNIKKIEVSCVRLLNNSLKQYRG